MCGGRLLLPLPFFSFGEAEDRHLLRLQTGDSFLSPSALTHLRDRCLALFKARVRLSWRCSEAGRRGGVRSGQLSVAPQLTLEQLSSLLAPPVTFSCACQLTGDGPSQESAEAAVSPQPLTSPTHASLSPVAPSRASSTLSTGPFARTVGNVLMQEKLARAHSLSATPALPRRAESGLSEASALPSPRASTLSPVGSLLLRGFGPHRVPVGSFVRLTLEVKSHVAVLGELRLRLHLTPDEAIGDAEAAPFSLSSAAHAQRSASVLVSGALSQLLPPLAPHRSVRHSFALCCLAKGRFAYRIHCSAVTPGKASAAGEGAARSYRLNRLRRAMGAAEQPGSRDAPSARTAYFGSETKRAEHEGDREAPHWFPCPHRLVLDAVV